VHILGLPETGWTTLRLVAEVHIYGLPETGRTPLVLWPQVVVKVGKEELCTTPIAQGFKWSSYIVIDQTLKAFVMEDNRFHPVDQIEVFVNLGKSNLVRHVVCSAKLAI
jgi:hypothetical protein